MVAASIESKGKVVASEAPIADLVADLASGPVVVEAAGRPVAVLIDAERFRDMQAVYEWHERVLQEHRAS
jgi:PHD/YefM family antitoxin component YafN of YafNO toxin-antitoxin module